MKVRIQLHYHGSPENLMFTSSYFISDHIELHQQSHAKHPVPSGHHMQQQSGQQERGHGQPQQHPQHL